MASGIVTGRKSCNRREAGLHGEATRATYHGTNGSKDGSLEHIHRQGLRCTGSRQRRMATVLRLSVM